MNLIKIYHTFMSILDHQKLSILDSLNILNKCHYLSNDIHYRNLHFNQLMQTMLQVLI